MVIFPLRDLYGKGYYRGISHPVGCSGIGLVSMVDLIESHIEGHQRIRNWRVKITLAFSYGYLSDITVYKWDYTLYKWIQMGYKYL